MRNIIHDTPKYLQAHNRLVQDGEVYLFENFLNKEESNSFFDNLSQNIQWRQEEVKVFGQVWPQPRLVAWHGDNGLTYTYSGFKLNLSFL